MLYFYNNTIYSTRSGNTVVFRLSTNEDLCDARNNIFFTTNPGTSLAMLAESGNLNLANNWAKSGWRNSFEGGFSGSVAGGGSFVTGTTPGFADAPGQNFSLLSGSDAINAGVLLHPDVLPMHSPVRQYVRHQLSEARPISSAIDIGAYEFAAAVPMQMVTTSLPNTVRFTAYNQTLQAAGGSGEYVWSITAGMLPPGLQINGALGVTRGKARLKGVWSFTVTVQDSQNRSATVSHPFTITSHLHY